MWTINQYDKFYKGGSCLQHRNSSSYWLADEWGLASPTWSVNVDLLASLSGFLLWETVQFSKRSLKKLSESCKYLFCAIPGEDSIFSWERREMLVFPKARNGDWACRISSVYFVSLPPSPIRADTKIAIAQKQFQVSLAVLENGGLFLFIWFADPVTTGEEFKL